MPGHYTMVTVRCDGTCSNSSVRSEGKRSSLALQAAAPIPAAGRSHDGLTPLEWSSIEEEGTYIARDRDRCLVLSPSRRSDSIATLLVP